MLVLLGVSIALNVLLFVKGFILFKQCDNLNDLLAKEAKDNVILQSKLDKYDDIFKQYYGGSNKPKPTMIIDEDWDDED